MIFLPRAHIRTSFVHSNVVVLKKENKKGREGKTTTRKQSLLVRPSVRPSVLLLFLMLNATTKLPVSGTYTQHMHAHWWCCTKYPPKIGNRRQQIDPRENLQDRQTDCWIEGTALSCRRLLLPPALLCPFVL